MMRKDRTPTFELPKKLERILASLATCYGQQKKQILQRLLVNARYHVDEGYEFDNWDGGIYGHAVYFQVPMLVYGEVLNTQDEVSKEICEGINRIAVVPGEYIARVFLELQDDPSIENWRENSGMLMHATPSAVVVSEDQLTRLWQPGHLRLFLSHKATHRKDATSFKEAMDYYGVSCFVAHEDIEPTKEWQDEIERALFSMEALAALMTDDFSDSCWTDQEVGVALGRQIPIIPIRLGMDPYGFIGKYQAVAGTRKDARGLAREVYDLLWARVGLKARLTDALVARFENADSFGHANKLMEYLKKIENVPPGIVDRLEKAPQENNQVRGAFQVQRALPALIQRLRGTNAPEADDETIPF